MKSNRVLSFGGIVLMAAFVMGTSAQASPLNAVALSALPEPATFVLVALILAVLPFIRKSAAKVGNTD